MKTLDEIRRVFCEAIEKQTRQERQAYLDDACRDNPALRAEVDALLEAHYGQDDLLSGPILGPLATPLDSAISEAPGTIIDKYKLLEQIGEGGMAVVYMAEQERPIRRKVALKIIKLGMDTKSVIARFEAERQALAMMDHPNIAKVLDAGATETGRPYFVMELVTGVSITEYCDKNNLSTKERLALFIQVCNAVQHAHQKGIIHRDIKPTNVMVTQHEGTPVPKVIDFGIAKATNQRLTEKTLFTRYAHIIGTPAYMSPEQADMSDLDADTRSDIYSLGVLLYELLTGATPFSEEELRKAGYIEMQRVIREQEPPKPSAKLGTLGETLTDTAKHHASTPDLLTKAICGDLDWIVMKTLEKARDRRYDTVSALAMDVQRHIEVEPILARPPSAGYRLQKFLRRHRSHAVAGIVILGLCIALAVVLSSWYVNQIQIDQSESSRHKTALYRANQSLIKGYLDEALAEVKPLLASAHVGTDAHRLHDRILSKVRERVSHYTANIEAEPEAARNYLRRAQHHYYLDEMDKMRSDLAKYSAILNPSQGTEAYDRWFNILRDQQKASGFVFANPVNPGPFVNTLYGEGGPDISPDGLTLYFNDGGPWPARPDGYGGGDLWVTTRRTLDDPWTDPVNLGPIVNSPFPDGFPRISTDGLSLYFFSDRPGGFGEADVYVSKRTATDAPWGKPRNLGPNVNSVSSDLYPHISDDNLLLYFGSYRSGEGDIYMAMRSSANEPFGPAENIGSPINTADAEEGGPWVSHDGCTLFFSARRGGRWSIFVSRRQARDQRWNEPVTLGPPVSPSNGAESGTSFTADGKRFFFHGSHVRGFGGSDLWEVRVLRMPDGFAGDGISNRAEGGLAGASGKEVSGK